MAEIFVGALPFKMSQMELEEIFSKHGPLRSIQIFADWEKPQFEPYALIDLEQAESAIECLDGVKIRGNHIRVHQRLSHV